MEERVRLNEQDIAVMKSQLSQIALDTGTLSRTLQGIETRVGARPSWAITIYMTLVSSVLMAALTALFTLKS